MPLASRRVSALALLAALLSTAGGFNTRAAQPEPKPAPEPTAAAVKVLKEKFAGEREEAVKAKFPPEALARADEFAKRAEAALKADDLKTAGRYFRDARWQLPYLPVGLPPHVSRVFGESRMRHADRVNGLSYSPDGTRLATASRDGTVKVWDLGNGRELVTYRGHADQQGDGTANTNVLAVSDVAYHPEGKVIASAAGGQVHLWEPTTGKQLKVLVTLEKNDKPIKSLAFRPDGKALAVGGDDGILRVFETDTGKATFTGPTRNSRIEKVAFSPNGKLIGVADSASFAAVYAPGLPNPMPMSVNVVDPGETLGVAFTTDGGALFTCGRDGKARLTAGPNPDGTGAGNTATRLREFVGHTGAVQGLAVTPDGKALVTGGEDRTVRVWDVTSGKPLRSFQGHMTKVTAVGVRGDGRQVASASDDGAIRLWDLGHADDHKAVTDATDSLWAVAVSPDGKRFATAGADKTIRVYDPETGKLELTLGEHKSPVTSLAFFPDGNRLASAGGDRVVKVWDIAAKKAVTELAGHESAILSVAVGGGGKLVVSGAADKTVRGFDPESGKANWTWTGKSPVCGVAVRPDGKFVAAGLANGGLVVLDVSSSAPREVFAQPAHVAGVACVAYSPDGSRVASVGGDGAVRIWTVTETGALAPLARFEGQSKPGSSSGFSPLTAVAFSPDGRFVATAGADAVVRVWDIQTKAEIRGLRGHTEWATAVAFGPDGRLLISAGVDKAARVFELAPQETSSAAGHLLKVNAVAASPNGQLIATAATDQTIKLWDLATGKEVATLIGPSDTPLAVTFLGNDALVLGTRIDTTGTGRVQFWSAKPGRLTRANPTGEVYAVLGAADGSQVAVWAARPTSGAGMNNTYDLYDKAGELVKSLSDKGRNVRAATFTPDLAWAVAGDETGTLRIWDLAKQERVGSDWPLFSRSFGDVGITPDKKLVVGMDDAGLVKVADVAKRETLTSTTAHKVGVQGLVVSPTGDTFLTVGADREIKLWSLRDTKELKELRAWTLPTKVNGAVYTPDGKAVVTANADGTAYVLELP